MAARRFIALLRGINVGGHNRIPMAELRAACTDIGWRDVQTYIQSGNIIFSAQASQADVEKKIEQLITRDFGLSIPVIVRSAAEWPAYVEGNPFIDECSTEPNLVMLGLSKATPNENAAHALQERATHGERVVRVGNALWIYFGRGVVTSKLSPGLLDKHVGSPVTMRNWRTVLKLDELVRGSEGRLPT